MTTITASAATPDASRYLQQLCKHFAHKVPATWDAQSGQITFEPGLCGMTATGDTLTVNCTADGTENLERLMAVIELHLVRFAWREDLDLTWTDAETGETLAKPENLQAKLAEERSKLADKRKTG